MLATNFSAGSDPVARRRISDLDGPRAWPWIGNLAQIEIPRLHQQLEAWAKQHGPLYRLRLGRRNVLVVASPDLIAGILRDRPDGWRRLRNMQTVIREMGGHGLFSAEGEDWRRQRRLVMAALDPGHLKNFFPLLLCVTERLKKRFDAAARSGESIDLQATLMRYAVDVMAGLAFGIDMNTQEDPDNALQGHLDKIFPMLHKRINAPIPLWRYVKLPEDREFDRHLDAVHAAVGSFLQAARERMARDPNLHAHPTNLLEAMLAARDDEGESLGEEELTGNVLTLLLAGEDTTANTLCWSLYLLHAHPAAWRELAAGVDAVLGSDLMPRSFEVTRELDAVEHCSNESMRLRPVAPVSFLESNRSTELGGVFVPEDTFVICVMRGAAVVGRPASDGADFRPSRWRRESSEAPGDDNGCRGLLKASMPFGAGPRMCPGRYLSMLEMKMVLATLARNYDLLDVRTPDGAPPRERLAFTMFPVGLSMKLGVRG